MVLHCKTRLEQLNWLLLYTPLLAFSKQQGTLRVVLSDVRLPPKVAPTDAQVRYVNLTSLKRFPDGTTIAYVKFLGDSVAQSSGTLYYNYDQQTFELDI